MPNQMPPSEVELEGLDYWEQPPFEPRRRGVEPEADTAQLDAESEPVDVR